MKAGTRIIALTLLACCLLSLLAACRQNDPPDGAITVLIPQKVSNIAGWSGEEAVRQLSGIGEGAFSEVKADSSGNTLVVLQPEQCALWQERILSLLDRYQSDFSEYDANYRMTCSADCSELNLFLKADMKTQDFADYLMGAESLCALYQLFSGTASDAWYVAINIYNAETGKLVKSGDSNSRMRIDESDWKASE